MLQLIVNKILLEKFMALAEEWEWQETYMQKITRDVWLLCLGNQYALIPLDLGRWKWKGSHYCCYLCWHLYLSEKGWCTRKPQGRQMVIVLTRQFTENCTGIVWLLICPTPLCLNLWWHTCVSILMNTRDCWLYWKIIAMIQNMDVLLSEWQWA